MCSFPFQNFQFFYFRWVFCTNILLLSIRGWQTCRPHWVCSVQCAIHGMWSMWIVVASCFFLSLQDRHVAEKKNKVQVEIYIFLLFWTFQYFLMILFVIFSFFVHGLARFSVIVHKVKRKKTFFTIKTLIATRCDQIYISSWK